MSLNTFEQLLKNLAEQTKHASDAAAMGDVADDAGQVDLENMTNAERAEFFAQLAEQEAAAAEEAVFAKIAEDGTALIAQMQGRIFADAFLDRFAEHLGATDDGVKIAADEGDELYGLDNLTYAEIQAAVESGEFELVDLEKEAGLRNMAGAAAERGRAMFARGRAAFSRGGGQGTGAAGAAPVELTRAQRARAAMAGAGNAIATRASEVSARVRPHLTGRNAAIAGGVGAVGAGGAYALRRKKNR